MCIGKKMYRVSPMTHVVKIGSVALVLLPKTQSSTVRYEKVQKTTTAHYL